MISKILDDDEIYNNPNLHLEDQYEFTIPENFIKHNK